MTNNGIIVEKVSQDEHLEEVIIRCLNKANAKQKPVSFVLAEVEIIVYPGTLYKDIASEWYQKKKLISNKHQNRCQIVNKTGRDIFLKEKLDNQEIKITLLRAIEPPIKYSTYGKNLQLSSTEAGDVWIYDTDSFFVDIPPLAPHTFYIVELEMYYFLKKDYPERTDFVFVCNERKIGHKYLTGKCLANS